MADIHGVMVANMIWIAVVVAIYLVIGMKIAKKLRFSGFDFIFATCFWLPAIAVIGTLILFLIVCDALRGRCTDDRDRG